MKTLNTAAYESKTVYIHCWLTDLPLGISLPTQSHNFINRTKNVACPVCILQSLHQNAMPE